MRQLLLFRLIHPATTVQDHIPRARIITTTQQHNTHKPSHNSHTHTVARLARTDPKHKTKKLARRPFETKPPAMARRSYLALALAAALLVVSASAAAPVVYDNFAAALDAQAPKGYTYAKRLMDALDLRKKYSDPTTVATMLVPSDAAFEALAKSAGVTADELLAKVQTNKTLKGLLVNALAYNTIPGRAIGAFQFTQGEKVVTAQAGKALTAARSADGTSLSGDLNKAGTPAKIVDANIRTKAGVAHGVNAVLLPFNLPKLGPK